ncbi:MAG: FtsX-like permease family protein [Bacteroidales bacterium]
MIKNYFKSAWRNMLRSKLTTSINIFCLTLGISGAILIALYLNHEFSYDSHHLNHESIYRLDGNYTIGGNQNPLAVTAFPLGPALKQDFSEVKEYVRFFQIGEIMLKVDDNEFWEDRLVFTDSVVFDVFTHQFVYGQPKGALSQPNTAVLSRKLSEKLFGAINPVGQVFEADGENFQVTAMVEDLPDNTHLRYDGMLSIHSSGNDFAYSLDPNLFWNINTNYTYLQMHPGADLFNLLSTRMDAFNEKYISPVGGMIGATAAFNPVPLRRTHFTKVQMAPETGSRSSLTIFTMVALFLIIIAAVNYTNMATARATNRAREIGLRKVSGATRKQLMSQFLSESLLIATISLLLSLLLVNIFFPGFNTLADKSFSFSDLLEGKMLVQVLLITAITGLVAGIYPAVFLSRMRPATVLKSNMPSGGGSGLLRKVLVVFQFVISVVLIAGTLTVQRQLSYLQNKDLGFDKYNRIVVNLTGREARDRIETLENIIRNNPLVLRTAKTSLVPGRDGNINAVKVQSGDEMKDATITSSFIDPGFLDVLEIPLVAGRGFSDELRSDASTSVIVNEAAIRTYGWHDDPLGKMIQWQFDEQGNPRLNLRVVGVVEDFNFMSLHNPIDPLMMLIPEQPVVFSSVVVEYPAGKDQQIKAFLEETVKEFDPARLPNVFFLDHGFNEQFAAEEKTGKIFGIFALVCIAISFLGLFGLASFTTSQRRKEVGIRKVLGSSEGKILLMFYKDFSMLILMAILVAGPITWLLMTRWLQDFVYRIDMSVQPIVYAGILSIVVALATVSYHTLMTSRMNPTSAMRSE